MNKEEGHWQQRRGDFWKFEYCFGLRRECRREDVTSCADLAPRAKKLVPQQGPMISASVLHWFISRHHCQKAVQDYYPWRRVLRQVPLSYVNRAYHVECRVEGHQFE